MRIVLVQGTAIYVVPFTHFRQRWWLIQGELIVEHRADQVNSRSVELGML